ncbi:MAG: type II secretion system F family protein [Candidatus Saccharibacteria bacterium]
MLTYEYTARDPASGEKIKSTVEADSEQSAVALLQKQGLVPIEMKASSGSGGSNFISKYTHRIKSKDKVLFARQLSTLINAGLPLVKSLHNVVSQTQNKNFQIVINQVISSVESGTNFSAALGKFPDVFDAVFVNLVAAGEVSGTLDASLARLADQSEKDADIISKVRGAMIYPILVLVVMVGVIIFMVVKVVPSVQVVYDSIPGAQLPLVTKILVDVANFTTKFWWIEVIIIGVIVFFTTRWARTLGGKRIIDKLKMRTPPLGQLFMKLYMARFSRIGATLIASGVPLIQMLEITGKAVNNVHIYESVMRATEKVKGGKSLSEALKGDPNFLPLVGDMLHIGEESGSMEEMLGKAADYYEKEVDNQIRSISSIIEPALMIIMGVVALVVVAAVLLPIYSLAGKINVQ